ncbi:DUF3179 domain-containing protein [Phototrophicus methaneseepsis]|uniref:DUF3179 domain-containing protein n=1 Tax=Phototrophicus methaneseepsis TaxID=2710758 RepID=A0A7S8IE13_9CHLR|nr:DUF3179 domain-containing protein [Phototrophicus methaneseepsis]QPC83190.1 DUF3179 domain-containing protein [Phototrophicus methaneseepsis]
MRRWLSQNEGVMMAIGLVGVFILFGIFVLERKDMSMGGWRTDFSNSLIDMDELVDGGMGRDGIKPIDSPRFAPADTVDWLGERSPVILVEMSDEIRAYPLAVLMRHEIVNDMFGDVPIAVTFCPLCYSPIVYERAIDGETLRFGVTGYLYKSGFIMWDDRTESWWRQFTGKAIVGDYAGEMLPVVTSQVVGFEVYKERYPEGSVLIGDTCCPDMEYGRNPYISYDSNQEPLLFDDEPDDRMLSTGWVLASIIDDQPIAFPFSILSQEGVIHDTVGDVPVVVFWQPGAASPLDRASIDTSRDVGMAAVFSPIIDGRTLTFEYRAGAIVDTETDSTWNIYGEATDGPLKGQKLTYIECTPHFWFSWAEAHPDTLIYGY